jgi:hypothetical protein
MFTKHLSSIAFLFFFCQIFSAVLSAQNPEWINYNAGGVASLTIEGDTMWVSNSGGLVKIDLNNSETDFINRGNSAIPTNSIKRLRIDSEGNKWFQTFTKGLIMYDGTTWLEFNTTNSGIPSNEINDIEIDKNNKIWLGTVYDGVANFDGSVWTVYNKNNSGILDNMILYLIPPDIYGFDQLVVYQNLMELTGRLTLLMILVIRVLKLLVLKLIKKITNGLYLMVLLRHS